MSSRPTVTFRRATAPDAPAVADIWLRSYGAALPTVGGPTPTTRSGRTSGTW